MRRVLDLHVLKNLTEDQKVFYINKIGEGTEVEKGTTQHVKTTIGIYSSVFNLKQILSVPVNSEDTFVQIGSKTVELTSRQYSCLINLIKFKATTSLTISNAIENVLINRFFTKQKLNPLESYIQKEFNEVYGDD